MTIKIITWDNSHKIVYTCAYELLNKSKGSI